MKKNIKFFSIFILLCISVVMVIGCINSGIETEMLNSSKKTASIETISKEINPSQSSGDIAPSYQIKDIPDYSGDSFFVINGNQPNFSQVDNTSFESYSDLDKLGRCGVAFANIGTDLMPTDERGSIGQVKPSGWQTVKYDNVEGKYLYNRCHLIGYQLTGENANTKNLITGTRYMNVEGMLPFENMVADYIKETNNHVLYRVTPIFYGDELVAHGVQMEAASVEDKAAGICFNVFIYNVQPGISIDYVSGISSLGQGSDISTEKNSEMKSDQSSIIIRGNSNSKIYHCPVQAAYKDMANSKYLKIFSSEQEAIDAGYRKAKR